MGSTAERSQVLYTIPQNRFEYEGKKIKVKDLKEDARWQVKDKGNIHKGKHKARRGITYLVKVVGIVPGSITHKEGAILYPSIASKRQDNFLSAKSTQIT